MIERLTQKQFKELPLVIEGESKEVRYLGDNKVVIKFKPTVYSFTHNRCSIVPGSDKIRLRTSRIFSNLLKQNNINHSYIEVTDDFVLSKLVLPQEVEFRKYNLPTFVPEDVDLQQVIKAPPIETVVKRYLTGTTKHGCIGLPNSSVRSSHPFYSDMVLRPDGALPEMVVRFDWRNPLFDVKKGELALHQLGISLEHPLDNQFVDWAGRVADTVLPDQVADLFLDVKKARRTAFFTGRILEDFLASKNIVFYDMCLFIAEDGETVYGEISPDCGRYRHLDYGSLDKDVWRSGGSSEDVINKWKLLEELIS